MKDGLLMVRWLIYYYYYIHINNTIKIQEHKWYIEKGLQNNKRIHNGYLVVHKPVWNVGL